MESVSTTRSELLARRERIVIAEQGRELLTEKRRELMRVFHETALGVLEAADALQLAATRARRNLSLALGFDGPEAVESASWTTSRDIFLEASTTVVMGVRIPVVERRELGRSRTRRGVSLLGTSAHIDAVAEAFESTLDLVVDVAASELRLKRLAREIARTTRRANALEHLVVPTLVRERDAIELALQEREREEIYRLRRIKQRRERARRHE